jgi:hypothetical protein
MVDPTSPRSFRNRTTRVSVGERDGARIVRGRARPVTLPVCVLHLPRRTAVGVYLTGASGNLRRVVVPALAAAGHSPRLFDWRPHPSTVEAMTASDT